MIWARVRCVALAATLCALRCEGFRAAGPTNLSRAPAAAAAPTPAAGSSLAEDAHAAEKVSYTVAFTVAGAGDPRANGNYVKVAEKGGKPLYQKRSRDFELVFIEWNQGLSVWRIVAVEHWFKGDVLYVSASDTHRFPESGWEPNKGAAPAPTVRGLDNQVVSRRVLVAYASIGRAHESAARAIQEQLQLDMPETEVILLDTTQEEVVQFKNGILETVTPSEGFAADCKKYAERLTLENPNRTQPFWESFLKVNSRGIVANSIMHHLRHFQNFVLRHRWDLVISTHFAPALALGVLRKESALEIPSVSVITEILPHKLWVSNSDQYFVAAGQVRDVLVAAYAVPRAMVSVSGIPIRPRIRGLTEDEAYAAAAKEGISVLPRGRRSGRVVLALPAAPSTSDCVSAWLQLLDFARAHREHTVVAVTGWQQGLWKAFLMEQHGGLPGNFKMLTFTQHLPELMAISDIAVAWPGALVTSEALALGLPLMVVESWLGHFGKARAQLLVAEGAAVSVAGPEDIPAGLAAAFSVAGDAAEAPIDSLRRGARAAGHPSSAATVSDYVRAHFRIGKLQRFAGGICCCGVPKLFGVKRWWHDGTPDCRFFHAEQPDGEPLDAHEHVQSECTFEWGFNQRGFMRAAKCPGQCKEFGDYTRVPTSAADCGDIRHLWGP